MKDLVSVIVPVYNVEKYLKKCVDSILNSDYKNIEIILVDDGSKDQSGTICDDYKESYNNIKVIHKKNGGLSSARNAGIEVSEGEYILFIDSDDYITEKFVGHLVDTMNKYDVDVVQGSYEKIDEKERSLYIPKIENKSYHSKEDILEAFFIKKNILVVACGKLYKKDLCKNISFKEGRNHEDNIFIIDLFEKINSYACVDMSGYKYLQRSDSIVNSNFNEKKLDAIFATEYIVERCEKNWPKYVPYAKILVCKSCFYLYCDIIRAKYKNINTKKMLTDKFNDNYKKIRNQDSILVSKVDSCRFFLFSIFPSISARIQLFLKNHCI